MWGEAVYIVRPGDIGCANCEKIDFEARKKTKQRVEGG